MRTTDRAKGVRLLEVALRPGGERTTVELGGELDLSDVARAELAISEALAAGAPVVIDVSDLEFIDLAGAALLVRTLAVSDGPTLRPSRHRAVNQILGFAGLGVDARG
jgi:anti-anti-sigma factor